MMIRVPRLCRMVRAKEAEKTAPGSMVLLVAYI